MTHTTLITPLSRVKGKQLSAVSTWSERTNAGQSLGKGKEKNLAGGRACYRKQYSSFHIFSFLFCQKKQLPVSQTGLMSLPVVSNNGSILYLALCAVKIQPLSYMVSDRGFLYVYYPMDKSESDIRYNRGTGNRDASSEVKSTFLQNLRSENKFIQWQTLPLSNMSFWQGVINNGNFLP